MEDKPIKLTLDVEEPTLDEVKEDEVFVLGTNDKSFDSCIFDQSTLMVF